MSLVSLTINGRTVTSEPGKTILEIATQAGILIPTLCLHPLVKPEEGCRICVVEVRGADRLMASCATPAHEGMVVQTDSIAVLEARRQILELLLEQHYGDCLAPCQLACPAQIDIQGYLAHIAQGDYLEAVKLIREETPFPCWWDGSAPILARTFADGTGWKNPWPSIPLNDLPPITPAEGAYLKPEIAPASGHKVAVIGSGPGGSRRPITSAATATR